MAGPSETAPHEALRGAKIVNLVIDIGDFDTSRPHTQEQKDEHDRYIKGVRETADRLREQGIPTVWIAITDRNKIHDKWDMHTVADHKLAGLDPKEGDVIFEKRFMSGFPTREAIEANPALKDYIISQQRGGDPDYTRGFAGGPEHTLTHLLKDAKHVIVNGGMGQYCVTDNSIDAALQGKGVTIVKNNVMVWADMGTHKQTSVGDPDFAASQVQAMLDELKSNPALRALPPEKATAAIDSIKIKDAQETIDSIPGIKAAIAKQEALQGSGTKFGAPSRDDAAAPSAISAARPKLSMNP